MNISLWRHTCANPLALTQAFCMHTSLSESQPKENWFVEKGNCIDWNSNPIKSLCVIQSPTTFPATRTMRTFSGQRVRLYILSSVEQFEEMAQEWVSGSQDMYMLELNRDVPSSPMIDLCSNTISSPTLTVLISLESLRRVKRLYGHLSLSFSRSFLPKHLLSVHFSWVHFSQKFWSLLKLPSISRPICSPMKNKRWKYNKKERMLPLQKHFRMAAILEDKYKPLAVCDTTAVIKQKI